MKDIVIEELENNYHNKYQIDKLNEEQLLYHYTSLQGMKGILTSKVIFATEGKFLNDSSEMKYIKEIINIACDNLKAQVAPEIINEICWFNNEVKWLEHNVFVLSLSEHSDSLILWSNYSKQDGYSIGINPYNLAEIFFSERRNFKEINLDQGDYVWLEHGRVIYDRNKQINIVCDEIYKLDSIFNKLDRPHHNISDFSIPFFYRMSFYSAFFKDPGFCDEREYRIAVTSNRYFSSKPDGRGGFREVNGCLVPYLKIPLSSINASNTRPIKEIIIGPKNNLDIAKIGLQCFKDEVGFSDVELKKSKIPLRY